MADLTIEILTQIRDALRDGQQQTNERLDRMNQRLDQTNERLDRTNDRLERVEQGLLDLGKFMRQIALDQTRHERFHSHHIDVVEKDIDDLKQRVQRLEERVGDG